MRRRFFCVLLCLIAVFTMSGCGEKGKRIHLSDRTIVQGIAVDGDEEGYLITVQTYKSTKEGEGPKYEFFTSRGSSVFEAMRNLTLTTGKRAFFADNQVIVLGKQVLDNGLAQSIDYFIRDNEIRTNSSLLCTDGKASDILTIESEGNMTPAQRIASIIEGGQYNAKTAKGELMDIAARARLIGQDAYIPFATVLEENEKKALQMSGVMYFDDEYPSGVLNEEETKGLLMILNKASRSPYVVENDFGRFSFGLTQSSTKVEASVKENIPHFSVQMKVQLNLESIDQNRYATLSLEELEALLKEQLSKQMCNMAKSAVDKAFFEGESDIFLFGLQLKKQCNDDWKNLQKDWRSVMKKSVMDYSCEVHINRLGQEANPN